ncbi:hypothetical protein BH09BAC1_BH09BAC1_23660 [soil metagenome]
MKNFTKTIGLVIILIGLVSHSASAQVLLYEDFQDYFSQGWTMSDEDTLDVQQNITDDFGLEKGVPWITNPDPDEPDNIVAFSTSYYDPAGTADDWFIMPQTLVSANTNLIFSAKAYLADYPDGYEVRISTTDDIPSFFNNPPLLTVAEEDTAWTQHVVDLSAYAGSNVYIAFRNNSFDKYVLAIDDVYLVNGTLADARISIEYGIGYSEIPKTQLAPITYGILNVTNLGQAALTSVSAKLVLIRDGTGIVHQETSTVIPSLGQGLSSTLNFTGSYTPTDTGFYYYVITLDNSADMVAENDTLFDAFFVTDSTYSRDLGNIDFEVGFGPDQTTNVAPGGYFGVTYPIVNRAKVPAVQAEFSNSVVGDTTRLLIFEMNNGVPGNMVAQSDIYIFTATSEVKDFTFPTEVILNPGNYLFAVEEFSKYLGIGYNFERHTPNTNFLLYETGVGTWELLDTFVITGTFMIRPRLTDAPVGIHNITNNLDATIYPNPANERITVEATLETTSDVTITIFNTLGQAMISQTQPNVLQLHTTLNIGDWSPGIYLLKISTENATTTQRLLVE